MGKSADCIPFGLAILSPDPPQIRLGSVDLKLKVWDKARSGQTRKMIAKAALSSNHLFSGLSVFAESSQTAPGCLGGHSNTLAWVLGTIFGVLGGLLFAALLAWAIIAFMKRRRNAQAQTSQNTPPPSAFIVPGTNSPTSPPFPLLSSFAFSPYRPPHSCKALQKYAPNLILNCPPGHYQYLFLETPCQDLTCFVILMSQYIAANKQRIKPSS